jgi:hypothetical protein
MRMLSNQLRREVSEPSPPVPSSAAASTETAMDDSTDPHGQKHKPIRQRESAPKTPKLDKSSDKGHLSQVTSTDLSLYEHEDETVSFAFRDDELEKL